MSSASSEGHRLLYAPPPWPASGGTLRLSAGESRHGARALRLRAGEEIALVDGEGLDGRARIEGLRAGRLEVRLLHAERRPLAGAPAFEIALPWLRSPARVDWLVEKATELGARAIRLYAAARSLKRSAAPSEARQRRWRDLALAAMKQSGRAWCPPVTLHGSLAALLAEAEPAAPAATREAPGASASDLAIATGDPRGESIERLARELPRAARWLLVVGPEGGLADEESALLRERGALAVRLAQDRLRAETAALALCAAVAALGAGGRS